MYNEVMVQVLATINLAICILGAIVNALADTKLRSKNMKSSNPIKNTFLFVLILMMTLLFLFIERYTLYHAVLSLIMNLILIYMTLNVINSIRRPKK